eukprot:2421662-Pleurochrysis_carterae.AAC.2
MEEKDSHGGGGTPAPPAAEGKAEDVDGSRAAGWKKVVQLDLDRVLERADATDPCKVLAVDARAFSLETVEALKPCLELQVRSSHRGCFSLSQLFQSICIDLCQS